MFKIKTLKRISNIHKKPLFKGTGKNVQINNNKNF